jgi:hypothetical protein
MHARLLLPVPLLLLLAGCLFDRTTTNQPLEVETIAALEPGVTTARDAVALLGAPVEVVQLGRRSAYRYEFQMSKQAALFLVVIALRGTDTREDRAWLFFDEDDVLTHVATTFQGDDARYALPWTKLHE